MIQWLHLYLCFQPISKSQTTAGQTFINFAALLLPSSQNLQFGFEIFKVMGFFLSCLHAYFRLGKVKHRFSPQGQEGVKIGPRRIEATRRMFCRVRKYIWLGPPTDGDPRRGWNQEKTKTSHLFCSERKTRDCTIYSTTETKPKKIPVKLNPTGITVVDLFRLYH